MKHFFRLPYMVIIMLAFISNACISQKAFYGNNSNNNIEQLPNAKPLHTFYLIGDAGLPNLTADAEKHGVHKTIKTMLSNEDPQTTSLLFLGDNIYPAGLPDSNSAYRKTAEKILDWQIAMADGFNGKVIFVPGNHDWNQSHKGGMQTLRRQEDYINSQNKKNIEVIPKKACPGPEVIHLKNNVLLVILDSEWWLHKYEKPEGESSYCTAKNKEQVLRQLDSVLAKNKDKNVVIAAHHPLYTMGTHGGYFPLRDHFFPLTVLKKNLYFPLPVLGSIMVAYRKYVGHTQDATSNIYTKYSTRIDSVLQPYNNVVFVSGHDHNLQYLTRNNKPYLISGAGSKVDYVKRKNAEFAQSAPGFMRLLCFENDIYLEIYSQLKKEEKPELRFRRKLRVK